MTDTDFAQQIKAIGVAKGRVEMAVAICEWVTRHPNILVSQAARDLAVDLVATCRQIIKDAHP